MQHRPSTRRSALNRRQLVEKLDYSRGWQPPESVYDEIRAFAHQVDVAVIDSGFDLGHPALNFVERSRHFNADSYVLQRLISPLVDEPSRAQFRAGPSPVPHGTAVAGIIAAERFYIRERTEWYSGLAPGARILPIRVGRQPSALEAALAVRWATSRGARVINLSFSVNRTVALDHAIERAWKRGVLLCAAAGNYDARSRSQTVSYPASHPRVIAVGALDVNGRRKAPVAGMQHDWGSRFGRGLDVTALGINVPTLDERDAQGYVEGDYLLTTIGTSIACPQVSGLATLGFALFPHANNAVVRQAIEQSCLKLPEYRFIKTHERRWLWNQEVGYGRIDPPAMLRALADIVDKQPRSRKERT